MLSSGHHVKVCLHAHASITKLAPWFERAAWLHCMGTSWPSPLPGAQIGTGCRLRLPRPSLLASLPSCLRLRLRTMPPVLTRNSQAEEQRRARQQPAEKARGSTTASPHLALSLHSSSQRHGRGFACAFMSMTATSTPAQLQHPSGANGLLTPAVAGMLSLGHAEVHKFECRLRGRPVQPCAPGPTPRSEGGARVAAPLSRRTKCWLCLSEGCCVDSSPTHAQGAKRAVTEALSADAELREWQRLLISGRRGGDDGDPFAGCSALRPETQVRPPLAYLWLYFAFQMLEGHARDLPAHVEAPSGHVPPVLCCLPLRCMAEAQAGLVYT